MPEPSAIQRSVAKARRGDVLLQRSLANMYAEGFAAIVAEGQALANYIQQQTAKGAPVSPSWANRQARYIQLQSKMYQMLNQFGNGAVDLLTMRTGGLVAEALEWTREEAASQAPRGAGPGITAPGYDSETWSLINKHAMQAANAIITDLDSPLRQLLARDLPEAALGVFHEEWNKGLQTGKNPKRIASQIAKRVSQLTLARAQLIARTEFHRAYREGKREQFEESAVVKGWTWRAAMDGRTCIVCYAMHGTVHRTTETLEGHPACRCVMVPFTKDWDELGFSGVKDTRPQIETGEDRFRRLPADMQQRMLGPSRFKMYNEGFSLQSFVGNRNSKLWGNMKVLEPLPRGPRAKPPRPPGSSDPKTMEGWSNMMGKEFGFSFSGNPFTALQRDRLEAAFRAITAKTGFDLKQLSTKWLNTGRPNLGSHPLEKGVAPADYTNGQNLIRLSEAALQNAAHTWSYGPRTGLNGLTATAIHELGHAFHDSLSAALKAKWYAIHVGTGSSAVSSLVNKQINSVIQRKAAANRQAQMWQTRIDEGYGLDEAYMRKKLTDNQALVDAYERQLAALREAKAGFNKVNNDAHVSDYSKHNQYEDFAESWLQYINNPGKLREIAPTRYDFFKGIFG